MPLIKRPLLLLPLSVLLSLIYWSYLLNRTRSVSSQLALHLGPLELPCPNLTAGETFASLPLDARPRNTYSIFDPAGVAPLPPHGLTPVSTLPQECIEAWLAHGLPCSSPSPPPNKLSVLWTWVNGTDPLQLLSSQSYHLRVGTPKGRAKSQTSSKWYREHDELRFSVRSVLESLGGEVGWAGVVAMDYPLACSALGAPLAPAEHGNLRAVQVPQWLDPERRDARTGSWEDGRTGVEMRVVSHWEAGLREEVYNSFAIEAALGLGGLEGVGMSENFIYMNDDYFLLRPLSRSSFHSVPYGPVFRMQTDLLIKSAEKGKSNTAGEWAGLEWSGWLLDERFGARQRPYVIHVAKSMSLPLLRELTLTFSRALADTRSHPLRDQHDAYTTFLFPHFVIERHREALLWSFVVARLGGGGDEWGEEEMEEAWRVMGGEEDAEFYTDLEVEKGVRRTMEEGRVAGVLGEEPKFTKYRFSSHDGYPYTSPNRASKSWPHFPLPGSTAPGDKCTVEFELCLGTDGEPVGRASAVFRRVAFEVPRCGDCIINALVTASGELGLEAFLPPHPIAPLPPLPAHIIPHLPLVPTHAEADFSLSGVLASLGLPPPSSSSGSTDLRAFAIALLARYTYVLADTPVRFVSLRSPATTKSQLKAIDNGTPAPGAGAVSQQGAQKEELAMACLNDDIVSKEQEIGTILGEWMGGRWGREAGWERREGGWW